MEAKPPIIFFEIKYQYSTVFRVVVFWYNMNLCCKTKTCHVDCFIIILQLYLIDAIRKYF